MAIRKLSYGEVCVALAKAHVCDGHGPRVFTWGRVLSGFESTEAAAAQGARDWWHDTDQSFGCDVEISVERADGSIVSHRFKVGPEIVARRVDGRSGS